MAFEKLQLREAALDTLVDVAESLLELEDLLSHDRESKVARLDDAGVYGTDGDLVDASALDAHKLIHTAPRRCF